VMYDGRRVLEDRDASAACFLEWHNIISGTCC
jgi:hypothetical protein